MKRLLVLALLAAAPAALAAPVPAAPPVNRPVGGGAFGSPPAAPPAVGGERPDGKPYTQAVVPPPLPECPANGLVLYKDYDADEVAKLEPIVASDAYQAL